MNKIEQLLKEWNNGILRGSKKALADLLGVPDTSISHWIAGRANPSEIHIKKMSKIFKKSEQELRDIFKEDGLKNTYSGQETVSGIPVWGVASASFFRCINMTGEPIDFIPIPTTDPRMFAMKVKGDCMSPKLPNGYYVILKQQDYVDYDGQIVLAMVEDECTLKRFFKIDKEYGELRPTDTERFKSLKLPLKDIKIMGVYKGKFQRDEEI